MLDFKSSLPRAPWSPSPQAATTLQQQHQCHRYQCQQSSPLLPVMEMLSQQMQQPANQNSLETETESTHDLLRRVQNRAQGPSRRERTIYTPDQLQAMEELFRENRPSIRGLMDISATDMRIISFVRSVQTIKKSPSPDRRERRM
ncbi:hypothetical protein TcWFU_005084 [Taenia crassiceps]|uniref:Homeobox domain-containing protein n=1 Tax=Taenia crassiceps TaxID=6207 RepID=A0ABR4Q6I4_9CEST